MLVAAGAFAVGKLQSGGPDRQAPDPTSSRSGKSAARLSSPGGEAGGSFLARSRRESSGSGSSLPGTGSALTADQMTSALQSVMQETDPLVRQRRFAELLESLTPENAEAAVRALQEAPRSRWSWGQEFGLLTYAWGRIDGEAAVAFAREQEGRTREWTMTSVLAGWAKANPLEAMSWIDGVEDAGERHNFTRGLVYGLAQRDVNQATDYVLTLSSKGDERAAEYMGSIARHQLSQGYESAAAWSDSLPDGPLKASALDTIAGDYARRNPEDAAAWVSQYAESADGARAIREVSEEWAERDPTKAIEWVSTLPEGSNRTQALSEAISEWAERNPTASGEYLAALPGGEERDMAISAYARRVLREEPEGALAWTLSIGNEEVRNRTIVHNVREWAQRDLAGAARWMKQADLAPEVVAEIKAPREDRR